MTSAFVDTPGTLRPLVRLSLPVLLEQVLHLCVGFADLWLTARLLPGESYIAAMTLVIYMAWMLGMMFQLIAAGSTPLTARFCGAREYDLANRVMNQSMLLGAAWALTLVVVGMAVLPAGVRFMGLEGATAEAARQYLWIELLVLPAIMIERVGVACLRGAGDTASGLFVMAIVNLTNIAVSYALVTGAGGLPALGWTGVAVGTAVGHVLGGGIFLALLIGGRAGYSLRPRHLRPDFGLIRRILRVGVPGGLDSLMIVFCNLAYVRVVLSLGDVAAAAHGVAIQIEALAFMPGGAFAIAATTMAGQYLGAGDPERATRSVLVACAAASVVMVGAGFVFLAMADELVVGFLGEGRAAAPEAARILRLMACFMLPLAVAMVLSGGLRGAGDTRTPLLITLFGFGVVRIPLAIYLAHESIALPWGVTIQGAGLGVYGAWCGAVSDLSVRALLTALRFWQGGWKRIEV